MKTYDANENDRRIVLECVEKLASIFDTVQVLVSREDEDTLKFFTAGSGNLFARVAQAELFASEEKEGYLRSAFEEDETDEGEDE